MPKRRKVKYWLEPGRRAAEEFAYTSPMLQDLLEHINRDEQALLTAFRDREDCEKLTQRLQRLRSNAHFHGFFEGFVTGHRIAREKFKPKKLKPNDSKIIGLIKQHPDAGPTEICEMIDEHNIRAKDSKHEERVIAFPFDDLKSVDKERVWTKNASVPKVKQRISDLKRKAWLSLYASQFEQPRFIGPVESSEHNRDREGERERKRDETLLRRRIRV
jgi:hypothetical protein